MLFSLFFIRAGFNILSPELKLDVKNFEYINEQLAKENNSIKSSLV